MGKHTPGPWVVERQQVNQMGTAIGEPIAVVGGPATGEKVGFVVGRTCDYGPHGDEQTAANARLIAAAPDLLEACKDALGAMVAEYGSNPPPFVSATFDNLRAAIAKAEGTTP